MRGAAREVGLVDRTRERARAVATDLRYGTPLWPLVDIRDGDFNDLAGAALVMVTAGVNEKSGGAIDRSDAAGRLKLLDINRGTYEICESVIPRLVQAASSRPSSPNRRLQSDLRNDVVLACDCRPRGRRTGSSNLQCRPTKSSHCKVAATC